MIRWVNADDPRALPLVAVPDAPPGKEPTGAALAGWVGESLDLLLPRLHRHGAILFRGFQVGSLPEFERVAAEFCPTLRDYVGGNSPRQRVSGHVYTATEYPRSARISLHNEASYLPQMPARILFFCQKPADHGGRTPLADSRRVLAGIDPEVVRRFRERRVRYVNNLQDGYGIGLSWMNAFQTSVRAEVEERLRVDGYQFAWTQEGLRTFITADATSRHPVTGEEAWTNQAEQWHPSSLDSRVREELLSIMSVDELPHNACFGDGGPFPEPDLESVRAAMRREERAFDWEAGDVLLCDNVLVMHGREPYAGERRVFTAFG
jgi:hypothetical protein